jgi:hypothetical protein
MDETGTPVAPSPGWIDRTAGGASPGARDDREHPAAAMVNAASTQMSDRRRARAVPAAEPFT